MNDFWKSLSSVFRSINSSQEIPVVKQYFIDDLEAPGDTDLKKVIAAAIILHKPEYIQQQGTQAAANIVQVVDSGMTTEKVTYQVGTGALNTADAMDVMVDHASAQTATVVKTACERVGGRLGTKVGTAIGSIFGPAGAAAGAVIGGTVGRVAGKFVGEVVVPAVKKVAEVAKKVVHTVWEGVKEVGRTLWEGVKSLFSWR